MCFHSAALRVYVCVSVFFIQEAEAFCYLSKATVDACSCWFTVKRRIAEDVVFQCFDAVSVSAA